MTEKYLFLLTFFIFSQNAAAQIGDKCNLKSNGKEGECRTECRIAEEQANKGIEPTLCGFHDLTIPIVCCEKTLPQPNDYSLFSEDNSEPEPPVHVQSNAALRISEQKCEEYNRAVTSIVQVIPLVFHSEPINITVDKCDYNSVPLIVGGEPASPGEFPFMAAIGFNTDDTTFRCGGTLISAWFVLTAAHCTFTRDAGPPSFVRLGDLILSSSNDNSKHKDYKIAQIINHPEYRYSIKYNDISLLKTETKVEFTNFIRPACLYTKPDFIKNTSLATGWGKTDFAAENSERLMKVTLNIYPTEQCYKPYKNNKELPRGIISSMICAGETKGGKDTCQGDSGGPLLVTEEGNQCKFYVVGITSFGKSCGQINTPAVYTRVSEFIDWLEKIVW